MELQNEKEIKIENKEITNKFLDNEFIKLYKINKKIKY